MEEEQDSDVQMQLWDDGHNDPNHIPTEEGHVRFKMAMLKKVLNLAASKEGKCSIMTSDSAFVKEVVNTEFPYKAINILMRPDVEKRCANCQKENGLFRCPCHLVLYCGKDCQKVHRPQHATLCKNKLQQ